MKNNIDLILGITGFILAEIGGIWTIKVSQRSSNPSFIKRIGQLVCILGIIALIFILFALWGGAFS
jgi:hypothetical protein